MVKVTDYASFVNHLTTFLWKQNDAELIAAIPSLIQMADAELSRRLQGVRRETMSTLTCTTSDGKISLNPNETVVALSEANCGTLTSSTIMQVFNARVATKGQFRPIYAVSGSDLYTVGEFSVENPLTLTAVLRIGVPDYEGTDASWLADEILDVYTYATLKHCAPWLREDERIALWLNLFETGLTSFLEQDAFQSANASPLNYNMPRKAP